MSLSVYATPTNNHTDTKWGFEITPSTTLAVTELRNKIDASGTYVFYEYGTAPAVTFDVLSPGGVSTVREQGSSPPRQGRAHGTIRILKRT